MYKYFPHVEKGQQHVPFLKGITRVVYDSLYNYNRNAESETSSEEDASSEEDSDGGQDTRVVIYKLFNFQARFNSGKFKCDSRLIDDKNINMMKIADVTHIGLTHIIFLVGSGDCFSVLTHNEIRKHHRTYTNQLGSFSRLVTFRHNREAFGLQENGCLWRIHLEEDLMELEITQELVLWEGEIPLNRALQ